MTPEGYIKKLDELKKSSERSVIGKLPAIERQAFALLDAFIDANLDVQGGKFVPNANAIRALNSFSDLYTGALAELSSYKGSIGQYLKNFKDISTLVTEFQKDQGLDIKKARLGAVQEIVVNEIINRYSENGLNANFVQPMRQLLFQNITGGTSKVEAMAQLKEFIAGGQDASGKLSRYLEQTAQQGVDSYTGAINSRIMKTFDIDTMIMSGSLIQTSSPQCRYSINKLDGIIEREDWPTVEKMAKEHGLIEGTTFENLPFNKLHWGCRHEFTPAVLSAGQKKILTKNPTNN